MKKKIFGVIILFGVLLTAAGVWYVNDYYHSEVTIEDYASKSDSVQVTVIDDGVFLDGKGTEDAIIFYPGAKVEYTSYLPLFYNLAEQGVDCFLVKMPFNLAIFGKNKADDIISEYNYEDWYLSGHSLGGAMAASYASKHLDTISGLILLAAYPTSSLQSDNFSVISIYGSEDGVLNMKKLEKGRKYMPEDYTEICINGGNHAWFGNYGKQEKDNEATISHEEQQRQTIEAILSMLTSTIDLQ